MVFHPLFECVDVACLLEGECAHFRADEGCEVCARLERLSDIACECPDIGAFAAYHTYGDGGLAAHVCGLDGFFAVGMLDVYRSRFCGGFSVHVVAEELNLVDDERLCLES